MGINEITQIIGTLGFPIVCCGALFWYMVTQRKEHQEEIKELNKSIDNNTIAITKLVDHLEKKD